MSHYKGGDATAAVLWQGTAGGWVPQGRCLPPFAHQSRLWCRWLGTREMSPLSAGGLWLVQGCSQVVCVLEKTFVLLKAVLIPGCFNGTFTGAASCVVSASPILPQAGTASLCPLALVLSVVGDAGFWELFSAVCRSLNQLGNGCPGLAGSCLPGIGSDEPSALKSRSAWADVPTGCGKSLLSAPASDSRH